MRFRSCIAEKLPTPKIDADTMAAHLLGVEGIPTLVINGGSKVARIAVEKANVGAEAYESHQFLATW